MRIKKPLVLVVDDHIPAVGMLTRLLERENYEVISAYDGEQAIDICKINTPDLILLDVMMPKLNGFEVLKILRSQENTQTTPTILITAKNTPDDIEHGLELGADDYISKPFNPRELLARAKSKIEAQRLKDELESKTQDLEALLRLSEELKYHLNINELMELILYLILDLLSGEIAILCQINGDSTEYLISHKNGELTRDQTVPQNLQNILHNADLNSIRWTSTDISIVSEYTSGMICKLEFNGEIRGLLGIFNIYDYTESQFRLFQGITRQATLALRNAELYEIQANYANHLEEMVQERTEELQSAQQLLIRSEKLASIGRLSAGIAHEINNPLFPLRINLEHMLEDIETNIPIVARDVEETLKSVERISRIVKRLLEFTGKDNSNQPDMEIINLNMVMESVISLSKKYLEHSHVHIVVDLPALPSLYGNRDQIEQVFLNIIINAKAAMPDGGELVISGQVENNVVELTFSDTGTGIAQDLVSQVFEPFISTKEDGTGLGLFISYSIIENHQGTIDVESTLGEGATFIVRLPVTPITN